MRETLPATLIKTEIMISNPNEFYRAYQKDYHNVKVEYLMSMLDNTEKFEKQIFTEKIVKTDEFRRMLKSELRQTYFHSIETLFELIFALKNPEKENDFSLQLALTYSNWKSTFSEIQNIADDLENLAFLDRKIDFNKKEITIGEYIFYMGIFHNKRYGELKDKIIESLDAIKMGLRIIANDFVKREEYNAYKHGLRIIPSVNKFMLLDHESLEEKFSFDLSDSMSFFVRMDDREELKVVTKVFDSERDYKMTKFCSALIHQIIFYRRILLKLPNDENKFEKFSVNLFSRDAILEYSKTNLKIQDIIHTQTKA